GQGLDELAAGGAVGRVDLDDQAPHAAADQGFAELLDELGMAVGGEDDAGAAEFDLIEAVEELLLRGGLVGDEVNIVDGEEVEAAHPAAKGVEFVGADG